MSKSKDEVINEIKKEFNNHRQILDVTIKSLERQGGVRAEMAEELKLNMRNLCELFEQFDIEM